MLVRQEGVLCLKLGGLNIDLGHHIGVGHHEDEHHVGHVILEDEEEDH